MNNEYVFRDQAEAEAAEPNKHSALGQFTTRLRKAGAYAFEDFRERELKLILRWAEYGELNNLLHLKDNGGSERAVAYFAGRQSVFEEITKASLAVLEDRAAAQKGKEDDEQ